MRPSTDNVPPPIADPAWSAAIDRPFTVQFTHRLRFTDDVLGSDGRVLLDLLEPGMPARVLAVVDRGVDAAGGVARRLRSWADRCDAAVELVDVCLLDGGESIKNDPQQVLSILDRLNDARVDRRNYVLAVGGGAFLDAVGFASALAHRGVRLVRLPTTVMGQADSGVGVKNAVNFFGKKNWLGTFAVPWGVVNDRTLLATLPDREWRCGFAEAVKVSLLKEAAFFDRLCADAPALARRDWRAAAHAISRSAHWHLTHITQGGDPFETCEARPLDFGHWSAHRIEAMTDFTLRHGEAVALGVAIDCVYSSLVHGLPMADARRVVRCLGELGLALRHACLDDADAVLAGLEEFRQHLGGRLTVTMLQAVGQPCETHTIDLPQMRQAIEIVRDGGV